MNGPTFGSLFSGIGGIDLGLERAGWTGRWQVEWDDYCQHVLAHHWPDIPRYGDITAVDWSTVEPVDLIAGGFPCQPFSLAGQRRGKSDDRWLWPAFAAAVRALRPRYVLVENVPGLLAGHGGMGSVLGDLAELGYDAEWDSIPAAAVGAPHLRYRVWIVAHANGGALESRRRRRGAAGSGQPAANAYGIGREGIGLGRVLDIFRPALGDDADGRSGQMADADEPRLEGRRGSRGEEREGAPERPAGASGPLPDAASIGRGPGRSWRPPGDHPGEPEHALWTVADADGERQQTGRPDGGQRVPRPEPEDDGSATPSGGYGAVGGWWSTEPDVGRVAHGVPARVDRLRALGNAVVPQVVEVIGRRLLEVIESAA